MAKYIIRYEGENLHVIETTHFRDVMDWVVDNAPDIMKRIESKSPGVVDIELSIYITYSYLSSIYKTTLYDEDSISLSRYIGIVNGNRAKPYEIPDEEDIYDYIGDYIIGMPFKV